MAQLGEAGLEPKRELYRKFALEAEVEAFWPDMPALLAESRLAICRAGGTTLAELSLAGTPALLLPYPHAADDHQRKNAEVYVAAGAAAMLDEHKLTGRLDDHLANSIARLLSDMQNLTALAHGTARLARPRAAEDVAALVWSLITSRAHKQAAAAA